MATTTTTTMMAIMPPFEREKEPSSAPEAPASLPCPFRLPIEPGSMGTSGGAVTPGVSSSIGSASCCCGGVVPEGA